MSNYKVPMRMCVACRQMYPKMDMIRVVRYQGEYTIDNTHKANGRGAYVCNKPECISKCNKSRLMHRAFKCNVDNSVYEGISGHYE